MKKTISTILVTVVLSACSAPKSAENKLNTMEEKQMSIKQEVAKGALMVDVRTPEEFASGSVKGGINIPLNEVESRINEFKGKPAVVVFCRSGKRSGQAKEILENNGIKNVINGINTDTMNAELAK
ncbi:MAG: rhodanese-like domain-containing protein [Cloacibacterium sp.]|nr:rhodanese-like domain-containing protein [Cloacibacterium sp.]